MQLRLARKCRCRWLRIEGIEENDAGVGTVRRHSRRIGSARGNHLWERDRSDISCAALEAQCGFGEAIPCPIALQIERKGRDPLTQKFARIGERERAGQRGV